MYWVAPRPSSESLAAAAVRRWRGTPEPPQSVSAAGLAIRPGFSRRTT